MKVYSNLIHKFVSGISVTTSTDRTLGPFGLASRAVRDVKSPYQNGYYIASFVGSAGDVLMDLRGNFTSTYASPFVRGIGSEPGLATGNLTNQKSTTSTIKSQDSAGSGYHSDHCSDDDSHYMATFNKRKSQSAKEPRLHNQFPPIPDFPILNITDSVRSTPPPPPPRYGLKSLKPSSSAVPRKMSRKGAKGAILMHRPILAK